MPGFANRRSPREAIIVRRIGLQNEGEVGTCRERGDGNRCPLLPTTQEISEIVNEESAQRGMRTAECIDNGRSLYLRSIGAMVKEPLRGDTFRGGVAVRVIEAEVCVQLYVLRLVCKNGAMMGQNVYGRRLTRLQFTATADAIAGFCQSLRDAVYACAGEVAFANATEQIRSTARNSAEQGSSLLEHLPGIPRHRQTGLRRGIVTRLTGGQDRSLFGLMNAITSVARDESDPEVRWRLEELGGRIPALQFPAATPHSDAAGLVAIGA